MRLREAFEGVRLDAGEVGGAGQLSSDRSKGVLGVVVRSGRCVGRRNYGRVRGRRLSVVHAPFEIKDRQIDIVELIIWSIVFPNLGKV